MLEKPTLDYPTLEKPTLENPTQLNKDILTKEKPNTDLIKYLFPSYPFPNPSPLGAKQSGRAVGMEKNGNGNIKILFVMLRSRTSFLRGGV